MNRESQMYCHVTGVAGASLGHGRLCCGVPRGRLQVLTVGFWAPSAVRGTGLESRVRILPSPLTSRPVWAETLGCANPPSCGLSNRGSGIPQAFHKQDVAREAPRPARETVVIGRTAAVSLAPIPASPVPRQQLRRVCGLSPPIGLSYVPGKGMHPRLQPAGLLPPPDIEGWLTLSPGEASAVRETVVNTKTPPPPLADWV